MSSQLRFPAALRPNTKMGRNDPCWCGSGKKWKVCHRGREDEARVAHTMQPITKLAKSFRAGDVCYHPDAPDFCQGAVINSHTVQRNGPLRSIARNGHVYAYRVPGAVDENKLPKLIGIRDASTFPGFCTAHDTKFFAPVETGPIEVGPQAAFLLTYRALVYELHQKKTSLLAPKIVATLDGGRPLYEQAFVQQIASDLAFGTKIAATELENHWNAMKADFKRKDFSRFQSIFIFFDRVLPFVSSFFVAPYEDFNDQKIQGWFDAEADYIAFSSVLCEQKSVVVLSWDATSRFGGLADQLEGCETAHVATLLFRFALANSENVFLSPDWYEGLGRVEKSELGFLFNHNMPGTEPHRVQSNRSHRLMEAKVTKIVRTR